MAEIRQLKTQKVQKWDILERTINYSLRVVELYRSLEKNTVGRILGQQFLRAGTAVGANLHEAQGGQSRADFISKVSIAYKECREALYWLRVLRREPKLMDYVSEGIITETKELIRILSAILQSSKKSSSF